MQKIITRYIKLITLGVALYIFTFSTIGGLYYTTSGSMSNKIYPGDYVIINYLSFGSSPFLRLFGLEHYENNPNRGDIIAFDAQEGNPIDFVKRCVAKDGDEVIYIDKHFYVHSEDKSFMDKFPERQKVTIMGKTWIDNPYYGMHYTPEAKKESFNSNFFKSMIIKSRNKLMVDMKPIYIEEFKDSDTFKINSEDKNAFYQKVPKEEYYMVGDNLDNSWDSRFWGSIKRNEIIGKVEGIFYSYEDRDFTTMTQNIHTGKTDKHLIKSLCGENYSEEKCRKLWNTDYYEKVRFDRLLTIFKKNIVQ